MRTERAEIARNSEQLHHLAASARLLAAQVDLPLVCREPAYGVPGHAHCAACCYGTGVVIENAADHELHEIAVALRDVAGRLAHIAGPRHPEFVPSAGRAVTPLDGVAGNHPDQEGR